MSGAFRPYKGKWVIKEHTLKANEGVVEAGDMIQVTSGGITVELATSTATAIIGISVEGLAVDAVNTQTIRVLEPLSTECEFIGPVTDGAIAAGRTDSGRSCDLEDHEGVDPDTDTHHSLTIISGTIATADGATTAGEGIFRIAQTLDKLNSF